MYEKTYTKKELEEMFGITKNTVYDTIKACGLDTAKTRYTEEEIQTRFAPARTLLESGQATYTTLKQHFSMRSAQVDSDSACNSGQPSNPTNPSESNPLNSQEFLEELHHEITKSFEVMIESVVLNALQRFPEIAMRAAEGASHRGQVLRIFEDARTNFLNSPPTFNGFRTSGHLPQAFESSEEANSGDALVDWYDEEDEALDASAEADQEDLSEADEPDDDFPPTQL